ncbi:MAG: hypothetical protein LUM44_17750 [Pyrinomonadaceae bacterium]|nr:hypothetical protein [Pyrinomonadaceae bacterium]
MNGVKTMGNNLPYLNIYKGDFLRSYVSACSIGAQGLWFRLMILMHDSERAGYLCLNGEAMPSKIAAIKCAVTLDEYETFLAELMSVNAFATSRENIIYSPELVAQEQDRAKNAERQKRYKDNHKSNGRGNGKVTPEVTDKKQDGNGEVICLSSSSSSSSKFKNGSGESFPRVREDRPTSTDPPKRQWSELTPEEKQMTKANFLTHLQNTNPSKNVREIGTRLKQFCEKHGVKFALERLKGWVEGQYDTLTEDDFLTAFGAESKPAEQKTARQIAIENCPICDERGLIFDKKWKECAHKPNG